MTIQGAIDAAVNGNTIMVRDGSYEGEGNRDIDFKGKAITLRSLSGPEECTINVNGGYRGFNFHEGEGNDSVVDGFTIRNSMHMGIRCLGSSPTIRNCIVRENDGGGIYGDGGSAPLIEGCLVSGNEIQGQDRYLNGAKGGNAYGGGIYGSHMVIRRCTIENNEIRGGIGGVCGDHFHPGVDGGDGGDVCGAGVYGDHLRLEDCVIMLNRAYAGKGGDSIFQTGNFCGRGGFSFGGGVYGTDLSLVNCIVAKNGSAGGEGGVFNFSMLIDGPGGNAHGGGIYCDSNSTLNNCTIDGNWVQGGFGGGYAWGDSTPGPNGGSYGGGIYGSGGTSIKNCIVWDNDDDLYGCGATYSCIEDGDGGLGNIHGDPLFADSGDDYHLKSQAGRWVKKNNLIWVVDGEHSPCIDMGDPNMDWLGDELWPHGERVNIGAYGGTAEASMSLSSVGNRCDLNGDGVVDFVDWGLFGEKWLKEEVLLKADVDRDGIVDP
ncbi:MAG: hypothetical protein GY869_16955, partial [Planctomycetes bacterium]|nr:hypothetical protein [Planctomycetota bacterium]